MRLHEPVVILTEDHVAQGVTGKIRHAANPGSGLGQLTHYAVNKQNGSMSITVT